MIFRWLEPCWHSSPATFLDKGLFCCTNGDTVKFCQPRDIAKMPNTFKQCLNPSRCLHHGFGQAPSKAISPGSGLEKVTFWARGLFVLVPGPPLWYQALPMTKLAPARRRLQCTRLSIRTIPQPGNSYCVYYYKIPRAPILATAGFPPFSHPPATLQTLK